MSVVWSEQDFVNGNYEIWCRTKYTGDWSQIVNISNTSDGSKYPSITFNQGMQIASWLEPISGAGSDIYYNMGMDVFWDAPARLGNAGRLCYPPNLSYNKKIEGGGSELRLAAMILWAIGDADVGIILSHTLPGGEQTLKR
jgi:hypothetical protein